MTPRVYYNDNEPFVVRWLRNLIAAGLIPAGDVDDRPIQEVQSQDVRDFMQCHFFAGIGGWAYALQLAGWGDRPVWTGSCPCPSFSAAGRRRGFADARHLWPQWFRLLRECRPTVVFGEQVDGAIGHGWLDLVAGDLEDSGYAVAAAVLGAHSAGAPHRRQRLWFVADAESERWAEAGGDSRLPPERLGVGSGLSLAHPALHGRESRGESHTPEGEARRQPRRNGRQGGVQHTPEQRSRTRRGQQQPEASEARRSVDFWAVEPDVGRVADGIPARMGKLCGLGNAIVPQVAAAFIEAYLACSLPAPEDRPQ